MLTLKLRSVKECKSVLTISAHPRGHTLLESTVLASVAIDPLDGTLLVLGAGPVVDLLLDGAPEESLEKCQNISLSVLALTH